MPSCSSHTLQSHHTTANNSSYCDYFGWWTNILRFFKRARAAPVLLTLHCKLHFHHTGHQPNILQPSQTQKTSVSFYTLAGQQPSLLLPPFYIILLDSAHLASCSTTHRITPYRRSSKSCHQGRRLYHNCAPWQFRTRTLGTSHCCPFLVGTSPSVQSKYSINTCVLLLQWSAWRHFKTHIRYLWPPPIWNTTFL